MNVAFVGCGFVFDIYMRTIRAHPELNVCGLFDINLARLNSVSDFYNYHAYGSYDELLNDDVDIVVNLTSIESHFDVSKKAIETGKNVYSEKPIAVSSEECKTLFDLAVENQVMFYGAPCNVYSDSVRTMLKAVAEGGIGKPLLIYAELDDNPIHLMDFESVKSPSGAPWPLTDEIVSGCTYEHIAYHLVWICALLGPAVSVTAYSAELIDSKSNEVPGKSGTPDYSVACLTFACGATARVTCSVVAPRDHRMRIIGEKGEVYSDGYRQYQSPVYLEKYSKKSLNARKFSTLRNNPLIGSLFGIGGKKLKLVEHWKSWATKGDQQHRPSLKTRIVEWLRRKEVYAQDKMLGIAEMSKALSENEDPYLSSDFLQHINELTLLVQNAGSNSHSKKPSTTFIPLGLPD